LQRCAAESEVSCRSALAINPDSTAALSVLAELRADAGRFDEAEELFKRVIAIDPKASDAWAGIARLRTMTPADAAWLAAAQGLVEQGLPPERELSLRYAIGKYFDDVRDFEKAFQNFRRANELSKQCGPAHDRTSLTRSIDLIIRSYDQRWVSRARDAANRSQRPVFIVGMLRSGTSLAEQILASHPAIFGAGELTFWGAAAAANIAGATAVNASAIGISDATLAGLADDYLRLLQGLSADALRVVDKLPTNFLFLGLIHAALPHAESSTCGATPSTPVCPSTSSISRRRTPTSTIWMISRTTTVSIVGSCAIGERFCLREACSRCLTRDWFWTCRSGAAGCWISSSCPGIRAASSSIRPGASW